MIGAEKRGASGGKRRRFRRNCVRDDAPTAAAAGNREKKGEAATRARKPMRHSSVSRLPRLSARAISS